MTELKKYDTAIKNLGCENYMLLKIPTTSDEFYSNFKPVFKTNYDVENEYVTDPTLYPFSFTQLLDEVARLQAEYDSLEYQRLRAKEYPTMQEQLDMQYWDSIDGTTTWQDAIDAVKAKYPKPTES